MVLIAALLIFSLGNFFYPFSRSFAIKNFVKDLCLILKDADIEHFIKSFLPKE